MANDLRMLLLTLVACWIIDAYGLRDPAYEGQKIYGIPHPAVYVIDNQERVAWAKIESDYKQRPTNEEMRAALDSLK